MQAPFRRLRFPSGVTLTELLVVMGIIIILMSLLLPGLKSLREVQKRVQCSNNLRQIYAATMAYAADNNGYPPSCSDAYWGNNPFASGDEASDPPGAGFFGYYLSTSNRFPAVGVCPTMGRFGPKYPGKMDVRPYAPWYSYRHENFSYGINYNLNNPVYFAMPLSKVPKPAETFLWTEVAYSVGIYLPEQVNAPHRWYRRSNCFPYSTSTHPDGDYNPVSGWANFLFVDGHCELLKVNHEKWFPPNGNGGEINRPDRKEIDYNRRTAYFWQPY